LRSIISHIPRLLYLFATSQVGNFGISKVKVLPDTFRYPDVGVYEPSRMLDGGFGVFVDPDGRPQDFELVFDADEGLQRDIMERHWHQSQKFEHLDDGRLKMTFTVTTDTEVWPWIRSFGDKVHVILPRPDGCEAAH